MTEHQNVRRMALQTLLAVREDGGQSHFIMRETLDANPRMTEQERSFYRRLTAGTLEYTLKLDYIINCFSRTRTEKMKPVIREILRMAVYQISEMDAVPDSAAVNEAVKLAQKTGYRGLSGFVNGVLRAVSRDLQKVKYPDRSDMVSYMEIRYSMPENLLRAWIEEYGVEKTENICAGFYRKRPVTVRLRGENAGKIREELRDGRTSSGLKLLQAPYIGDAFYLASEGSPAGYPEFTDGSLIVQDVSSQIAVRAAGIREGSTVLDLCAAPGGKTVLAADLTGRDGHVFSRDISEKRAARIRENVTRCRLENVTVEVKDAREEDGLQADVVIADVPCSGFGDIGRKPEIRYRVDEKRIRELTVLQREILSSAVRHLKPGGTLLFSTCTFGHAENRDNFFWLRDTFGLQPVPLTDRIPEKLLKNEDIRRGAAEGYVQLLPGDAECDGFFFSCLKQI